MVFILNLAFGHSPWEKNDCHIEMISSHNWKTGNNDALCVENIKVETEGLLKDLIGSSEKLMMMMMIMVMMTMMMVMMMTMRMRIKG